MTILDLKDGYNKIAQDNTGITELKYDTENGWKLIRMNDTAHLE